MSALCHELNSFAGHPPSQSGMVHDFLDVKFGTTCICVIIYVCVLHLCFQVLAIAIMPTVSVSFMPLTIAYIVVITVIQVKVAITK